jgi:hypothetical protein
LESAGGTDIVEVGAETASDTARYNQATEIGDIRDAFRSGEESFVREKLRLFLIVNFSILWSGL